MKLAVPVFNGRVAPAFDWAGTLLVLEVADGAVRSRREDDLGGVAPEGRPARMASEGIEALVCGGISCRMAAMLEALGIRVLSGYAGEVEEIVAAFAAGRLPEPQWRMPGCLGGGGRGAGRGSGCGRSGRGHMGRGWERRGTE